MRIENFNASAWRLLPAALFKRWPQGCYVKITFGLLLTNEFDKMPCKLDSSANLRSFEKHPNSPQRCAKGFLIWKRFERKYLSNVTFFPVKACDKSNRNRTSISGENKRTIGRTMLNQLIINELIKEFSKRRRELWLRKMNYIWLMLLLLLRKKYSSSFAGSSMCSYYINRTDYALGLSQKSGLRRMFFDESCLQCIFSNHKTGLRHIIFIKQLLLNHCGMYLIWSF